MNPELINAILYAGLPMFGITFSLFALAYYTGYFSDTDDAFEDVNEHTDDLSRDLTENTAKAEENLNGPRNFIMGKWFEFGGGYYGLMALITFIHLEIKEAIELGVALLGLDGVESFIEALLQFLIQFAVESMMNFINALIWWSHWIEELPISEGSGFMWLIVSYAGYLIGEWLAGYLKKQ